MHSQKTSPAIIWNTSYPAHTAAVGHPETAIRVKTILEALRNRQLLNESNSICVWRRRAPEIFLCHTRKYVDLVESCCKNVPEGELIWLPTGDVTIARESFRVAHDAVSAACLGVDVVMQGNFPSAFVVIRPPGHHAESNRGMGFCLFNNIAIAARHAQKKWGISKVAIIDWDVHHGNGTEEIFLHDESVLYVSTHQEGIYPGTGSALCRGSNGEHIVNVPIAAGLASRDLLLNFYLRELPELLMGFSPELILISCGFDAHCLDPLGALKLRSEDYGEITRAVMHASCMLPNCRVVSILEGGYNLQALGESSIFHVQALQM